MPPSVVVHVTDSLRLMSKRCLDCGWPMLGVMSYKVRFGCADCGGAARVYEDGREVIEHVR